MTIHRSAVLSIAVASTAAALAPSPASAETPSATEAASAGAGRVAIAVDPVRFLPGTVAAETGAPTGVGAGWAGYDGATGTPLVVVAADVRLGTRVVVTAGASYAARDNDEPAALRPSVLARVQVLDQHSHGIDLGVAAAYRQDRFVAEEGLFQGTLSVGLRGELGAVLGSLGYGQDGEGDDHLGEARLVALHPLTGALHVGFDGHVQWLFDSTDPNRALHGTPSLELMAAPAMTYGVGPMMLMLEVGWSGVDLEQFHSGVVALGGVGTAF